MKLIIICVYFLIMKFRSYLFIFILKNAEYNIICLIDKTFLNLQINIKQNLYHLLILFFLKVGKYYIFTKKTILILNMFIYKKNSTKK
jgi:hypothetical protein